ncbi:cell division protein FtsL [Salisediminibacterium halotolerans]|uniref:Cell division protein FtsL n=1 Tax=Salisediminibacterium halotolerans TaxID=517425 RepID=A0A1H9PU74_9BACI|nr:MULTISPECIES: cell division protein FtsL [Salisediminibacterium]RLJ74312.1 cell division protein FtsL [Actinophytocola xinjiangensis]RPE87595.1 cell division protein FtsL [Salisediminibacterium halotolerans]TWG35149.1 cell division protein FtsL [Salisediminibacterium halotolerans]SER51826.1 cell division protein FtsL [Salisediminibacterium haloalkalitolerans]GEL07292.1 hypothetical protein SHA02_07080 [Salisediminibacterium halotolerans]
MSPEEHKTLHHGTAPKRHIERQTVHERVYKGGITKGEKVLYILSGIIIGITMFFLLSNYATMYSLNDTIQETETAVSEQQSTVDGLQLQVTELSDPERILHIAENELGMTLDDRNVQVIHRQE